MNDPQYLGLGELGQRVQAMSDPAPEPRLRPYQGGSQPAAPASNGRQPAPYESFPPIRQAAPAPSYPYSAPTTSTYIPLTGAAQPVESGPFYPHEPSASNGSGATGTSPAPPSNTPLLQAAPEDPNAPKTGLQRAVAAVRSAIPLVQRLLPLLDGNFATTVGALVAAQPIHHSPPALPPVHVNLEPVERGLAEVRTSNRELRTQVQEQGANLKRVEDQLDRVREATDRNTLEQQELVEDLRSVGNRISTFAIIGLVLLLISLGLNIYFLAQLQHILR
jgi:hypothetical protein